MNIEEIRKTIASARDWLTATNPAFYLHRDQVANLLDIIDCGDVFIAVPDGETCKVSAWEYATFTCDYPGYWEVIGTRGDNILIRNVSTDEKTELACTAQIQPVKMVPL